MGKRNVKDNGNALKNLSLSAIMQGLLTLVFLLFLTSLILALRSYFTTWQPGTTSLKILVYICIIGGAFWAGKTCLQMAWFHGLLVGVTALLLLGWFGEQQNLLITWLWWNRLIRLGFFGILGGVLGGLTKH